MARSRFHIRPSDVTPYSPANHTGTRNYRLIGRETVGARQVEILIGEVERGEKSISVDSLYHVAVALEVPLRHLTDVRPGRRTPAPSEEAERLFALVCAHRRPGDVRKALEVVRAMLGGAA